MFGWSVMTMIVSVSLSGAVIETDTKLSAMLATIGAELGHRAGAR